jgi:hypothetical protein
VLFVYRQEHYLERSDKRSDGPEHDAARGRAELIVQSSATGPQALPTANSTAATRGLAACRPSAAWSRRPCWHEIASTFLNSDSDGLQCRFVDDIQAALSAAGVP